MSQGQMKQSKAQESLKKPAIASGTRNTKDSKYKNYKHRKQTRPSMKMI